MSPRGYFPSVLIYPDGRYSLLPKDPDVVRTFYVGMNEREDLVGSWFNDPSSGYFALIALRKHATHDHWQHEPLLKSKCNSEEFANLGTCCREVLYTVK